MLSLGTGSRVCFLFKAPLSIDCKKVKDDVEAVIDYPNGIRSIIWDNTDRCFAIEARNVTVWEKLFEHRKLIQFDCIPVVLVFPQKILGNLRIVYDKKVSEVAKSECPHLYRGVQMFPVIGRFSLINICADTLNTGVEFNEKLCGAIFEDEFAADPFQSASLITPADDPTKCSPLKKKSTLSWTRVKWDVGGKLHFVEIGRGDLFGYNEQALILPVDTSLACINERYEERLRQMYASCSLDLERQKYLSKNQSPKVGDVIPLRSACTISASVLVLVVIDREAPPSPSVLGAIYSKCFFEASARKIQSMAFPSFSDEKAAAESAVNAYMTALSSLEVMPKMVRFVFDKDEEANRFSKTFSMISNGTVSPAESSSEDEDAGKMDVAMASNIPKPSNTKNADAAVAQLLESMDATSLKQQHKPVPKPRPYGKRSASEKLRKRKQTKEKIEEEAVDRAVDFVHFLNEEFPPQDVCFICEEPFKSFDDNGEIARIDESELCQRCYRPYHPKCLDKSDTAACVFCYSQVAVENGIAIGDQPKTGMMNVRVVNDPTKSVPGYPNSGHIEITYSIPSSRQQVPKPNTFCFGTRKIAYLPNTEEGAKIAKMLSIAFDRGLIFCVKRSLALTGDYNFAWSFIPHKVALSGGRIKWGYPDDTYLARLKRLLVCLGIETNAESEEAM